MHRLARNSLLFLVPLAFSAGLNLLVLPLTTLVLGPQEYGIFNLVYAFAQAGTTLGYVGSSYLISAHYQLLDHSERQAMVSSILLVGSTTTGVFLAVLAVSGPWLLSTFPVLQQVPATGALLLALYVMLTLPWMIATDILVIEGRAVPYALIMSGQSLVWFCALVITLFGLRWGTLSLFVASTAGGCVLFVGAAVVLARFVRPSFSKHWLRETLRLGSISTLSSFSERLQESIESLVLGTFVSLGALGIYAHSKQYRTVMMFLVSSVKKATHPTLLAEARDESTSFPLVTQSWELVQILATLVGVALASLGPYLISILTHGKFTSAYVLATIWIPYVLIQTAAMPALGVLYVRNKGVFLSWALIAATVLSTIAILVLGPILGTAGVVAAVFMRYVLFRALVFRAARQWRLLLPADAWVARGTFVVLAVLGASIVLKLSLTANVLLWAIVSGGILFVSKSRWLPLIRLIRRMLLNREDYNPARHPGEGH
jgi:O-antigen/teichoic acid export membrane protein